MLHYGGTETGLLVEHEDVGSLAARLALTTFLRRCSIPPGRPDHTLSMDASGKLPEHYIAVLGDYRVGKQSIRRRFVDDVYWEQGTFDPALEVPRSSRTITIDNQQCVVHVWESNLPEAQERLIRGCDGVILVYTITSRKSFDSVKAVYERVRSVRDGNQVPIFLAGSRRDLEVRRQVAPIEAVVLAAKLRLAEPFREVSAKTGENVSEVFHSVVRNIRRSHAETGTQKFVKSIKQLFGGV